MSLTVLAKDKTCFTAISKADTSSKTAWYSDMHKQTNDMLVANPHLQHFREAHELFKSDNILGERRNFHNTVSWHDLDLI